MAAKATGKIAASRPLSELAAIIRSKNAGPFRLTFDILFRDPETCDAVWRSGAVTRETVARAYGVSHNQVSSIFHVPMGNAIKVTLLRPWAQNSIGESDTYGCQQHVPLMELPVTLDKA